MHVHLRKPIAQDLQEFDMLHLCAFTLTHCAKFNVHLYPCEYLHFSWYKSFHIFDMLFCIILYVHLFIPFYRILCLQSLWIRSYPMYRILCSKCLCIRAYPFHKKPMILSICLNCYEAAHW